MKNYRSKGSIRICLWIAIALSSFMIGGCSIKKTIKRNRQCKGIEKAIDPYWIRAQSNPNVYDVSKKGMQELESFRSCILLLRKKDVLRIFGLPSTKEANKIYYFLFGCQDINESSCAWIEFDFQGDEMVKWQIKLSSNTAN
jgi:hypothetical protein